MKKFLSVAKWIMVALVIALGVFLPVRQTASGVNVKTVLSFWQIDCFEGGTGSRASFIKSVAVDFEKKENCLVTVLSMTKNDAMEKLKSGVVPDVISYSSGLGEVAGLITPIDRSPYSSGGDVLGKQLAVAWAMGGYVKISKKNTISDKIIISKGDSTAPEIACYFSDIPIDNAEFCSPQTAAEKFKRSDYGVLIGTQRDLYRFKRSLENFDITPLSGFTDLIQYASVTSKEESKLALSKSFVKYLTSDGQKNVNNIGLLSVADRFNSSTDAPVSLLFGQTYDKTLPLYLSERTLKAVCDKVASGDITKEEKFNFLKNVVKPLK